MGKIRKMLAIALLVCVVGVLFVAPAYAENVAFSFNLDNTGTTYRMYTGASNTKSYANDPATVATTSNDAPGWGYAFLMAYYSNGKYYTATKTSPAYWISGKGIIHPPYLTDQNKVNRAYYVGARIDNDYAGPYSCAGVFNSDYTTPPI